jgi:hypothetical protein
MGAGSRQKPGIKRGESCQSKTHQEKESLIKYRTVRTFKAKPIVWFFHASLK